MDFAHMVYAVKLRARVRRAVCALCVLTVGATSVLSCGFEDPDSMDATRGLLNWAYPNALYVTTAVWHAENTGILPPRVTVKSRDFAAYLRTIKALKSLSRQMNQASTAAEVAPPVSIVLLDKVLWTRFEPKPGGFTRKGA